MHAPIPRKPVFLAIFTAIAMVAVAALASAAPMSRGNNVVLKKGSVDGLSAAIQEAGPGGTVMVQPGTHVETGEVLVDFPVAIRGKNNSVIIGGAPPSTTDPLVVQPVIRVKGTSGVTIEGLEFHPPSAETGNTAILVEDATGTEISDNSFSNYQVSVLIQHGDRTRVTRNRVDVTTGWSTGELATAHGIVAMNGSDVRITDNEVAGGAFGIWACGLNGRASGNRLTGALAGLILCNVPDGGVLISGSTDGSDLPATGWTVHGNYAADNTWGYMVTDGSNNNTLTNNAAAGSAVYDMELLDDSCLFGFFTPFTYDNVVDVGAFTDLSIKDCGHNNTVNDPDVDRTCDPAPTSCP